MAQRKRVTKSGRRRVKSSSVKAAAAGSRRKTGRRKSLSLNASVESSKRHSASMEDVLAWFKRDGRRYQTRINGALRRVMEREMKDGD